MTTVRVLEMTCDAFPAQWEGRTDDGRCVYVRYRSGWLRIGLGDTHAAAIDAAMRHANPDAWQLGGPFDGVLDYTDLIAATAGRFGWPAAPAR